MKKLKDNELIDLYKYYKSREIYLSNKEKEYLKEIEKELNKRNLNNKTVKIGNLNINMLFY